MTLPARCTWVAAGSGVAGIWTCIRHASARLAEHTCRVTLSEVAFVALPARHYNAFTNSPELVDSAPVQMEAQGDFEICSFVPFGDIPK